jgi:hypothetical protein
MKPRRTQTRTLAEALEKYLPDRPEGQCWVWKGYIGLNGYGSLNHGGIPRGAHRVVYEALVGSIPEGLFLRHSCDNPPCCNPAHLIPGTAKDNAGDMVSRERQCRGSKNHSAKLDEETVLKIRREHKQGRTNKELAAEYGLTPTPMSQLLRGITWRHVPLPDHEPSC